MADDDWAKLADEQEKQLLANDVSFFFVLESVKFSKDKIDLRIE